MGFFAGFVSLVCLCSAAPVWSSFACPSAEDIDPCACITWPRKIVSCNEVKTIDVVSTALFGKFPDPLPYLEITNAYALELPSQCLKDVPTRKLVVKDSNIMSINDDAFQGMDSLSSLQLVQDRLTEFPTLALERLPGLTTLSLAGNLLRSLTDESIEGLPNLKYLSLASNKLSHIERNSLPITLKSLSLTSNHLTHLNKTLKNLKQLDTFYAGDNFLTSVKNQFRGLKQLEFLGLDGNHIVNISESFDDLTSLTSLNLAYNSLVSVDEGLVSLTNLQRLNLSHNRITELGEGLFSTLNGIETLDLSGNYITNVCSSLKPLTELKLLSLSDSNLKKLDSECLAGMTKLQTLDLSRNLLTSIEAVTGSPFPMLHDLRLQHNLISDLQPGLDTVRLIHTLDVSENSMKELEEDHLINNMNLSFFHIGRNPWQCTDQLSEVFRNLQSRGVNLIGEPSCPDNEFVPDITLSFSIP